MISVQVQFITSKVVDFIQVASQGAEIKKLRNIGKVSKKGGAKPTTSLTFTNKTFELVVKNDAKTDIKIFFFLSNFA